ncbi:MAG: tetratricopeptide repeat protein [Bacteroidetes bacterium]|nr:tetratricopeptide repeat protein [Bacteroidota bacterium]MBL6943244.1 tetratricopeptide repeat protein [Bacteroidales bacterium]
MKFNITITLILIAFLLSFSATSQNSREKRKQKPKELTEKQRYEVADLFARGLIKKETGNLKEALELFENAIEINPNDAAANYEAARILTALGRSDEGLAKSKKATLIDSENIWYKAYYAKISRINENYDDYVKAYEEIVANNPYDLNFLYELAFAYQFTGDYENAISTYDKIEDIIGVNERIITQKTDFYTKLNNPEKGVEEYEKLITSNPDDPRYYALMAEYCSKNGMDDKAIRAYEKIVEINPDDPYVHISLADYYAKKGENDKSVAELKQGLSNPALDLKTKINLLVGYYQGELSSEQKRHALELSEILMEVHEGDPIATSFYASMLYENGEYEKVRPLFRDIVKSGKANYVVWEQLLFCDLYLDDHTALADESEECIDYFPNYPLPYFFAGVGNYQIKDYVKAKAFFESGKEFVVNNNALLEQFYSSIGDTYNELENYEASYSAYDKVLKLNPANSVVLNNYSYYLSLRNHHLDKAKQMAAKSIEIDPYNSNNLDTYAWVLYKLKDYSGALEWIEKAYNNSGSSSGVVLEHYGDILFKLNKETEALKYWMQAREKSDYSDLLDKKIKDKTLYE